MFTTNLKQEITIMENNNKSNVELVSNADLEEQGEKSTPIHRLLKAVSRHYNR